jgi:hypothetical protein
MLRYRSRPENAKINSIDLSLAFLIHVWEGSSGLQSLMRGFKAVDELKIFIEIRYWSEGKWKFNTKS